MLPILLHLPISDSFILLPNYLYRKVVVCPKSQRNPSELTVPATAIQKAPPIWQSPSTKALESPQASTTRCEAQPAGKATRPPQK